MARAGAPVDAASVAWLCLIGGFGAGLSVSPGLFVVTLSFERALVIGTQAASPLRAIEPAVEPGLADRIVRAFLTGANVPPGAPPSAVRRALALGIDDAYLVVLALSLTGIAAIAALLIATQVKLRAPDLAKFDRGEPALEARSLA